MVFKAESRLMRPAGNVVTDGRRWRDAAVGTLGNQPFNLRSFLRDVCRLQREQHDTAKEQQRGAKLRDICRFSSSSLFLTQSSLGVRFSVLFAMLVFKHENLHAVHTQTAPLKTRVQMFTPLRDVLSGFGSSTLLC